MSFDYSLDDDIPAVVIDNGSSLSKSGFAGDDAPRVMFPTLVGRPRHMYENWMIGTNGKDTFIGDEIQNKRDMLAINCPIDKGIVTNWDDMQKIWHHTFYNELRVAPDKHPVLLSEVPLNPKKNREKMVEVMFETFNTPAFYMAPSGVLAAYSSARCSAIVLDVGHEISHVIVIYEGHVVEDTIKKVDLGGNDLTEYLKRMLNDERGHSFSSNSDKVLIKGMKEKLCYVANDFDNEMKVTSNDTADVERIYELPDGCRITVGSERFRCAEPLFQPALLRKDVSGIHKLVLSSLKKFDVDVKQNWMHTLVLSGGCSMFPGLVNRLQTELENSLPSSVKFKLIAPPERNLDVWLGGSILAALSAFKNSSISKQEYEENGPRIIHRKCFN